MSWRFPPQVPNEVPVPLNKFTVVQNTDVIRLKNLLFDEMTQHGSHNTMCNGFESDFIENLNNLGFVIMATHGTPTIVRVPRADTLTVKNVPTREGT
jgi:predicted RNA binding protein YcfA (HicA-like mRNA interferase family)